MARIRTIKPEFWTSEQVMEITPLARLAFIAMWNFSDDHGVHPASYKTLRAEAFAGDDNITADTVAGLVAEMQRERLVAEFEVDGKRYWHVTGWARHQKIDKPTYRHPEPPNETTHHREVAEHSANTPRKVAESSPPESKGVEGKGKEGNDVVDDTAVSSVAAKSADPCPHQEIIDLYHRILPMGRQVRVWTDARRAKLRARWREDEKRQSTDWWVRLFDYIAKSEFLTGKVCAKDRKPFEIDLEWIITPANLVKIIEGKYDEGGGS